MLHISHTHAKRYTLQNNLNTKQQDSGVIVIALLLQVVLSGHHGYSG